MVDAQGWQNGQKRQDLREVMEAKLGEIAERIDVSAKRSGRDASDVTLVAVSKFQPLDMLYTALDCGVRIFGENRVQERADKSSKWNGEPVTWHMIGHLQRNKARKALELFDCIQSVDSFDLASALNRILLERSRTDEAEGAGDDNRGKFPIFVEVNTSGEESKHGASPGGCIELVERIAEECPLLSIRGLMTIGPLTDDEREIRSAFVLLRSLAEESRRASGAAMEHLSMGMTGDYEIAIEEGSTLVRIGTGIFGARTAG